MNCDIYKDQIIENVYNLSPEAKIHIESCSRCKGKYDEYLKFEKFIHTVRKNLLPNPQLNLQPQYVINLVFIKKAIQKNLASMKRLYIYATIILIIFIYTIVLNTFIHINSDTAVLEEGQYLTAQTDDKEYVLLMDELDRNEKILAGEILRFIDKYVE